MKTHLVLGACLSLTFFSAISQAADPVVTQTASMTSNRWSHTATLLLDGRVLIAGGGGFPCSGNACYLSTNHTAELYDSATGTWRSTGDHRRRASHSATLLQNGQVLLAGGYNYGINIPNEYLGTAELYDPAKGVWRATGSLNVIRGENNAVLLTSGKVLVVGTNAAELFDPSTETWTVVAAPSRKGPLALLTDGSVLTATGNSVELYDPATQTWSSAGAFESMAGASFLTLLRNGLVLGIGGARGETLAELYDPATRKWRRTNSPAKRRSDGTATLLSNGHVLFAGGYNPEGQWPEVSLRSMELFDPATETWTAMPDLKSRRTYHTATILPNDEVLVAGGVDGDFDIGTVWHASAELLDLQLPRPTSLSINPQTVSQGQCFTMSAGNGARMTLDVQYRLNDGPPTTLPRWPALDDNGRAENICTSPQTPIGKFEFIAIRNTETTQWVPVSATVTVTPPGTQ
jgi:N-acetylneuraminic acid mutarotase